MGLIKKALLFLLVIAMVVGGYSCMKRKNENSSEHAMQLALQYLVEKYTESFVIEELSRKPEGPFLTDYYSGYAHVADDPDKRFGIWVDISTERVDDSFECYKISEYAGAYIKDVVDSIWTDADMTFETRLDIKPEFSLSTYSLENIEDYFNNEFSYNCLHIVIDKYEEGQNAKIEELLTRLNVIKYGTVSIKYCDMVTNNEIKLNFAEKSDAIDKAVSGLGR